MYGEIFENNYVAVEAGLNDCKVVSFGLNPNGGAGGSAKNVLDLVLEVGGLTIRERFFEVTKGYPREVKNQLTGAMEMQTMEEAIKDAVKNQQLITKSFLTAMGVPTTAFVDGMKNVQTFEDYATLMGSLVPKDIADKDFECILQFDNKGYLKLPNKMYITGAVLRMKDSDQKELKISDKVRLVKPGTETEEITATEEVKW